MTNIVRRFRYESNGAPMANLRVLLNDIGKNGASTNLPLTYKLLSNGAVMRDNLRTNAAGAIAVSVEDVDGFEIVLLDVAGAVAYREKVVPGNYPNRAYVDADVYDGSDPDDDQPVAITLPASVSVLEDGPEVTVPYSILYASGRRTSELNNTANGGDGPYLCDFEVDEEAGLVRITPRSGAGDGACAFYIESDITGRVLMAVTVTPSP